MFGFPFGWRKASKCKKLTLQVQCRLKFLKIKKSSITKRLREDIVELLSYGKSETAFSHAEKLVKEQSLLSAYDLLEHFCESIIIHLPYIRKQKNYSNEINEAVSTLIFAASWCGDLPELQIIKKLFRERHGNKFIKAITELHRGNHVNTQVKEKLCLKSIPYNMKQSLIVELAKDFGSNHLLICGNDSVNWEGLLFEAMTQCDYGSSWPADDKDIQVEEIHMNTLEDSYAVDKTMFLFNSTLGNDHYINRYSLKLDPYNQLQISKGINISSPCKHVHPKLPDYDELVAKFKGLKRQYQQREVSITTLS